MYQQAIEMTGKSQEADNRSDRKVTKNRQQKWQVSCKNQTTEMTGKSQKPDNRNDRQEESNC